MGATSRNLKVFRRSWMQAASANDQPSGAAGRTSGQQRNDGATSRGSERDGGDPGDFGSCSLAKLACNRFAIAMLALAFHARGALPVWRRFAYRRAAINSGVVGKCGDANQGVVLQAYSPLARACVPASM